MVNLKSDREMYDILAAAVSGARRCNVEVRRAVMFLEAGEWLLALLELEDIALPAFKAEFGSSLDAVRQFMGDPPDPYL